MQRSGGRRPRLGRRRFLRLGGAAALAAVAGCTGPLGTGTPDGAANTTVGTPAWYGSGPGSFGERPPPGGTSMDEMPDLEGTLTVYSGRGEALVGELFEYVEARYPDFTLRVTPDSAATLANRLVTEGANTPADVFYSVNAGSLGFLAEEGRLDPLAETTYSLVPPQFRPDDGSWVGTSGRARTIPYNTDRLTGAEVPTDVMAFPDLESYAGEIGWAPTYSSFQGFVTAMRILEGEAATREWLRGMLELGVEEYTDEFAVARAVADGEVWLGFANHYYIQRVLAGEPEAPIATAFTRNDAGSVFNVAGAGRIDSSDSAEVADAFVRHLLSAEAQEYFATRTFEYPLVEGVDPVGRLPPVSTLDVPDVDLTQLSNLDETVELMRDVGVI